MTTTPDLFSAANLARHTVIPVPPALVPHSWPYPGLSPLESAQSAFTKSSAWADMLALVILKAGGEITQNQVLHAIPADWRNAAGRWAHGHLSHDQARVRGIHATFVNHEGSGGFHFSYQPKEASND